MEFSYRDEGPLRIIDVTGTMAAGTAGVCERIIAKMKRKGVKSIKLDLTGVKQITGSGLGMVSTLRAAAQKRDLDFAVTGFEGRVASLFRS